MSCITEETGGGPGGAPRGRGRRPGAGPWTPDLIERLRRHFADGLSPAESARRLGFTRLAVLGKRQRLGLKRPSADGGAGVLHRLRARWIGPARPPPDPPPEILHGAADLSIARPLAALGADACRWPLEPTAVEASAATLFCGQPAGDGRAYCGAHHALSRRQAP